MRERGRQGGRQGGREGGTTLLFPPAMGSTMMTPSCHVFFFFRGFLVYMAVKCLIPPPVAGATRGSEGEGPVLTTEEGDEKEVEEVGGLNRLAGGLKKLFVALGKEEEIEEEEEEEEEEEDGGQGMFSFCSAAGMALVMVSVAGILLSSS